MAEKIELFELDIDMDALLSKSADVQKNIASLSVEMKDLKKAFTDGAISTEEYYKEFSKLDAALKTNRKELNTSQKLVQAYTDNQSKQIQIIKQTDGSINQLSAALAKNRELYRNLSKEQRENADIGGKLLAVIDEQDTEVKNLNKSIGQSQGNVGNYSDAIKEALPGLSGMTAGIVNATKAAIRFIATPLGAVLALIAGAVAAVRQAFQSSEEGQNKYAKLMAMIGAVLGNLTDLLSDFGEALIFAIENPQKAWDNFVNAMQKGYEFIKGQTVDRLKAEWTILAGTFEAGVLKMRIAWNEFTGDDEEAEGLKMRLKEVTTEVLEATRVIQEKNQQIVDGYNAAIDAVGKFIEENQREAQIAAKIADDRARADKLAREQLVERATLEGRIANLKLQSRETDKFSEEERRGFLVEAAQLTEQLFNKEVKVAKLRADALTLENTLSKTNKEAADAEAQAKADLIRLEKERADALKELTEQRLTLDREIQAQLKAEADRVIQETNDRARLEIEIFKERNKSLVSSAQILTDELVQKERERLERTYQLEREFVTQRFEQGLLSEQEYILEKLKLDNQYLASQQALEDSFRQQQDELRREREAIAFEEKLMRMEVEGATEFEMQLAQLEREKQAAIAAAEAEGRETTLIEQFYAKKRMDIKNAELNTKLQASAEIASGLVGLLGEETEAGKFFASAAAIINTYRAATLALATYPPPFGAIAAGVSIATGLKSVAEINKTKTKGPATIRVNTGRIPSRHTGGLLTETPNIPTQPGGDNLLITAKRGEVVLNENQQAALGGAMTFRSIGVPGFNTGGIVGGPNQIAASAGMTSEEFARAIGQEVAARVPKSILVEDIDMGLTTRARTQQVADV